MTDSINMSETELNTITDPLKKIKLLLKSAAKLKETAPQVGLEQCQRAHQLLIETDPEDHELMGAVLTKLGELHAYLNNYASSVSWIVKALPHLEKSGDLDGKAKALLILSSGYQYLGDYPTALTHYLQTQELYFKAGNRAGEALTLTHLGALYDALGESDNAINAIRNSLQLYQPDKPTTATGSLHNSLAVIYMNQGDYVNAIENAQTGLQVAQHLEHWRLKAVILCTIGEVQTAAGHYDEAQDYFQQSIVLSRQIGFHQFERFAFYGQAQIYLKRQQPKKAIPLLQDALQLAESIQAKQELYNNHELLAEAYTQLEDFAAALHHYKLFHTIKESILGETADKKIKNLEVLHRTQQAQQEAEIYRLKNIELAQAKKDAEMANRAKSAFLAHMSHELRTPLTSILLYTDLLQRYGDAATDRHQRGLTIIKQSGEHLLNLINHILDLSKIEADELEITVAPLPLPQFLTETAQLLQAKADEKKLSLICDISPDLPAQIVGDKTRLRQVLFNLLGNAIKFTEQGEVTLRSSLLAIEETAVPPIATLRFEIIDCGSGIDSVNLNRIFQPFVQTDGTQQQGTGLGLTISQRLVNKMGGEINVESAVGQGSRFWFELSLPIVKEASELPKPLAIATGYQGRQRHILVVDDAPTIREALQTLLTRLGFKVTVAENGRLGLELAQTLLPDMILMDLMMPEMDGLTAVNQMRQIPILSKIPIIAISASMLTKEREQSLAAGFDDFLPKPIQHAKLFALLKQRLCLVWTYDDAE